MMRSVGHKKSARLVEGEAYRRIIAGEAPETLTEFAQQLLDWFTASYPEASPMTQMAIEDQIRDTWHRRHELIQGGGI
jgi:hypothetical protein